MRGLRGILMSAAADPAAHAKVLVVGIDEDALAKYGRWPWPRDTLATVLDHLERQQPAQKAGEGAGTARLVAVFGMRRSRMRHAFVLARY